MHEVIRLNILECAYECPITTISTRRVFVCNPPLFPLHVSIIAGQENLLMKTCYIYKTLTYKIQERAIILDVNTKVESKSLLLIQTGFRRRLASHPKVNRMCM